MITYINVSSVKLYVKVQNTFGSFKVLACLVVILGGVYELSLGKFGFNGQRIVAHYLVLGKTQNLQKGFEGTSLVPKDVALAFYSGLWAYDGWLVFYKTISIQNCYLRNLQVCCDCCN